VISWRARLECWELIEPFVIARGTSAQVPVLVVELLGVDGHVGRGEAAGVDYDGETPAGMAAQIAAVASEFEDALDGACLQRLLPPGGARNALDCALWDLRAKQSGIPAWQTAGLAELKPVTTVFTIGLGDPAAIARKARAAAAYPILKIKVDAERHIDVVRLVRQEHPHARLIVDANEAWSRGLLERLLEPLAALGVELIEQPLPRGEEAALDGLRTPVPLAADESCTDAASLARLAGRYGYVNIKLDKCGGLTEALAMAQEARRLGLGLMIGNMCGTSLAMAPAFVLAQSCRYVDLDGPLLQREDRKPPIRFETALMHPPERALWG